MQNEIWKPLKNYEDLYEVSNFGNIKGLPKGHVLHHGSAFLSKEKILKPSVRCGYSIIVLYKNKTRKTFSVHRLIANAFLNNENNKEQVNHINGKRSDNRIENLEWCTRSENIIHSYKVLKRPASNYLKVKNKKEVCQISLDGFIINDFSSIAKAAIETGISRHHIALNFKGKRKSAGGFLWI